MTRIKSISVTWVLLSIVPTGNVYAAQETSLQFSLPGQNIDQINAANGICVQYQGLPCQAGNFSTTNPIGIKFPALYPPRVKIATTSMSGSQSINQYKGTLSFDYTTLSTEQSDWGKPLSNQARIKTLFKWGDTDQQFQVIIYNDGVKSYLAFRHDATNNCNGSACQRSVSTSRYETGDSKIIMGWKPGETHKITVSWNFRTPAEGSSSMGIYIDGKHAIVETKSSSINSDEFYQPYIYLGTDQLGGNPAQGIIGNLKVYSDEFFNRENPVDDFINWKKDNGVWDPHETVDQTLDAPQPFNTGNNSLVFYKTADYLPVFPGQTPNANEIKDHVDVVATRNEFETTFFNVYFGANVQGIAEVTLSNLVRTNATGSEQISCKDVMVRTVKYWWQAGSGALSIDKEAIPAFLPELLLYNEASVPTAPGNTTVQIPSDSNLCGATGSSTTFANIQANTSKQFSITLRPDGNRTPGTYQGTIAVKLINGSVYSIPIYINILDITLPAFNKYATIYNEFSGTISTNSELKTKYRNQLKDIRDHGFNGVIILAGKEKEYLDLAVETGLSSFTMFKSLENTTTTKAWFTERNMRALFLGQDEPHLRSDVPQALAWQVLDANKIHSAGGEVASTINKEYADQLNNPLKFPWASTGIPFTLGKLDFPILNAEPPPSDTTSNAYFSNLINGTKSPDRQELIYWQAAREQPRVNRYFAGYFMYLSRLAGIAPYVYQKNRDNTFNDFVVRSNGERSLNLVYPSIEGGIDTIQWESIREGIDDHRMLQLFDQFYRRLLVKNQTAASSFKAELDTLMQKYKSWAGSKSLATEDFSKDRISLLNLLTRMQNSIVAHSVQLSISENEDDGWEFEDGGQIYRPNGYQIFSGTGGNYFGTWASYSHYGAALRFHIPLTAKKSSNLYSATLRLLRNNVSATGTPKVAIKAYKNTDCTAYSNNNRPYRDGVEYTTASTTLEFPNPELNAVGSWIDIDITAIMHELIQQPSWTGTNSSICFIGVNLMASGSHEFGIRDSAEGAHSSPRLILDYE